MESTLLALLATAVVGFVPGALLYRVVRPAGTRLECAALAPTISYAVIFLFGEVADLVGLPFAPGPFLVLIGLTAVVAVGRRAKRRRTGGFAVESSGIPKPAAILLLAAIVLGALVWILGSRGLATTPPYTDSVNHGVMVAQVVRLESLDPGLLLSSDLLSRPTGETAFYPLALHGHVALVHRLFGVSIADGLYASTLLFSAVIFPIGLFFAARTLRPRGDLVPGLAALLGSVIGFVPILPMSFGGLPLVIGLAMVPGVATLCGRYLLQGTDRGDALVGVLGLVGVLATHTSEIPLLAILLGCSAVESWVRKDVSLGTLVRRGAVLGSLCLLLVAPILPSLVGGTSERSGIDERAAVPIGRAVANLRDLVVLQPGFEVFALLAAVGVVLCIKRRRHLGVVGGGGVILLLYFIAACHDGPLSALTVPWYQHPGRVALNFAVLVPFFAALALHDLGPVLRRVIADDGAKPRARPAVLVAALFAVLAVMLNSNALRTLLQDRVLVGSDAREAFAYLRTQVEPGERILNDGNTDGAMWMYAYEGLVPVMGLHPARPGPSWEERVWLLENLPRLGEDPRVDEALEKYNARFVYFDLRTFPENPHHIDGKALEDTPRVCERLRRGTVRVLEIVSEPGCHLELAAGTTG